MAKSDVAQQRTFENVYICMKCNARLRVQNVDRAKCRKCGYKGLRKKHADMGK